MAQKFRFRTLVTIVTLVLSACTINTTPTPEPPSQPALPEFALELTVSADTSTPFNTVGQEIKYSYLVRNSGSNSLAGPVNITDDKAATSCPDVGSLGGATADLDPNEQITCTGTYPITQADLDTGSVTNNATASASGTTSNAGSFPVTMTQNPALTLSKAANPITYNKVGDVINYTYVITNTGNVTVTGTLSITDDKVSANCTQPVDGALSPNEQMSCTAAYSIAQADLDAGKVTNNASASNGTTTSGNETITVNKTGTGGTPPAAGTTVQHVVVSGEWLWQIARCYGANPKDVINANKQLLNPSKILAGITVTVPNVGSAGTIYGQPCVRLHTVQSGDTWTSIAQTYSADVNLLQRANPGGLSIGRSVKVPVGTLTP